MDRKKLDAINQLFERLDKNFAAYNASLMGGSKQELVAETDFCCP